MIESIHGIKLTTRFILKKNQLQTNTAAAYECL